MKLRSELRRTNRRVYVCFLALVWFNASDSMADAVVAPLSTGSLPLKPIDSALQNDLQSIEFDPLPEALVKDIHYVASDEGNHHHFRSHIANLGGVFVGLGTNQNYTMLPWMKPELAVMLDFDQMVVDVHNLYRVAFMTTPDPESFIKLWRSNSIQKLRLAIDRFYAGDAPMRKRVQKTLKYARFRIHKALLMNRDNLVAAGVASYLTDQGQYEYIVEMFKTGRIIALRGDLTKDKTVTQLGTVLREHGLKVRVYHPSNAEQYFSLDGQYRINMKSLPVDEQSMVVRTRAWAEFSRLTPAEHHDVQAKLASGAITLGPDAPERQTPPKKKSIFYTYATQSYSDFLGWLSNARLRNVRSMLPYESRIKNGHYAIKPPDVNGQSEP